MKKRNEQTRRRLVSTVPSVEENEKIRERGGGREGEGEVGREDLRGRSRLRLK